MGNIVAAIGSAACAAARAVASALNHLKSAACHGWHAFYSWVSQPHIQRRLKIALAAGVGIAAMVPFSIATFGFGPAGIVAGSAAAAFQSAMCGGLVPAGSWFATMTSLGMSGGIGTATAASAGAAMGILALKE